jgi:hypothetical protein
MEKVLIREGKQIILKPISSLRLAGTVRSSPLTSGREVAKVWRKK